MPGPRPSFLDSKVPLRSPGALLAHLTRRGDAELGSGSIILMCLERAYSYAYGAGQCGAAHTAITVAVDGTATYDFV